MMTMKKIIMGDDDYYLLDYMESESVIMLYINDLVQC